MPRLTKGVVGRGGGTTLVSYDISSSSAAGVSFGVAIDIDIRDEVAAKGVWPALEYRSSRSTCESSNPTCESKTGA